MSDKKEQKKDELKEMKETLQRVQAEFENYRKRTEKQKEDFLKYASSGIISEMLPILDSFELAIKNKEDMENFKKGVEMIYSQLFSLLEKKGLKQIEAENKKFNPYVHEALMQEESDKEDGMVIEEFQKGYMLGDHVLRHSKVKVSKGKKSKGAENDKDKQGHSHKDG